MPAPTRRMDETQLQLLLGEELDQAEAEVNSKVAKASFTMATQKNNVAAAIFWMKARAGWREKQEIDASITTNVQQRYVISALPELTCEQWVETYGHKSGD